MTGDRVADAGEALRRARGIVVLTGAGVSAESGVPTFRDAGGIWSRYRPEELATPEAFARDPRNVWEWYDLRRSAVRECSPNAGHLALARFLGRRADATLVTQNVDGLHQRALAAEAGARPPSNAEARVLELHGSLMRVRCTGCARVRTHTDPVDASSHESLPRCEACGALDRPDVVWFGELLPAGILDEAFRRARAAELCLVVGTSAVVHPAASVPLATLEGGGALVEVNPATTALTPRARWSLRGTSADILPRILSFG